MFSDDFCSEINKTFLIINKTFFLPIFIFNDIIIIIRVCPAGIYIRFFNY